MGNNLRELRKAKRFTQEQLAEAVGASKRQIGAWERGENELPMDYADTIADVLGCTIDALAGRVNYAMVSFHEDAPSTADERELLALYRRMEPAQRLAFMEVARSMAVASKKDGAGVREDVEVPR